MPRGGKRPNSGRPPGSKAKRTLAIEERLQALGCDPIQGMAVIASGKVPCGTCHGTGKTRYRIPNTDKVGERLCESCYGTLLEKVTPQLRGQMYAELAQYVAPKRKAVEVSNALDENGEREEFKIRFVNRDDKEQ